MQPDPGTIYRDAKGRPVLFVREDDQGLMFVGVWSRTVWTERYAQLPPEFELIVDSEGRRQANEESWHRAIAEQERDLAFELLNQACSWLPMERAEQLRKRYREAQP